MPHGLYGLAIDRVRLPLYFSKGNTLQARLPFQDTQSIRGLYAGNLSGVTGKDNSGSLILGEVQQALHLPARNHSCFINDQNPPAQRALWFLSLQKSGDSHRVTEANFFQFVHRTSGGSHRKNFVSGLSEATVNFTQCRRLASTGSASNIDRQIARSEYSFDGKLLFGTEAARKLKVTPLAEVVVSVQSSVNHRDYVALALEARVCRNFIPRGDESSFRTLKGERALKIAEFDVAAPVTKSLG